MDTSDSEYFESADEEIQSDGDEENTANANFKVDKNIDDGKITLSENVDDIKSNEENCDSLNQDIDKTETSIETQSITKHENKEELSNLRKDEKEKLDCEESRQNQNISENMIAETCSDKKEGKGKINIKSKLGTKTIKNHEKLMENTEKVYNIVENSIMPDNLEKPSSNVESDQLIEEENLWSDDELDWEAEAKAENQISSHSISPIIENKLNNERQNKESDSWSSWGNWGASVLSTATQSVSSITTQITSVIETGLGAVDPEELVRIEQEEKKFSIQNNIEEINVVPTDSSYSGFGLGNLVKLVENTGTKVISGGLDTLESIGKKTMEVLQEGDPGLKKKKAFLKIDQDKPVLSQILREAKEKAEKESRNSEQPSAKKWKNYETLFDDHHGLVHLEALELLSKQCEIKLKNVQSSLTGDEFTDFSETMDQIKELCELPDEDEEEQLGLEEIKKKLETAVSEMNIQISYEKLVAQWEEMEIWLSTIDFDVCDEKEVHQQAIETLAEMTSRAMEQFHKTGELLLIKERRSTSHEADSLVQITATLISLIGIVAAKFCEKLNGKAANTKEVSGLITNVFYEAANSSSYIQDALQLLIPVLQVGAT